MSKPEFSMDPATGQITEVVRIGRAQLERIVNDHNLALRTLQECSRWEHNKALDRRIAAHVSSEGGDHE